VERYLIPAIESLGAARALEIQKMSLPNRAEADHHTVSRQSSSPVPGLRQVNLGAGQTDRRDQLRDRSSHLPEPDVGLYSGLARVSIAVGLSAVLWLAVAGAAALLASLFWR
jgi:hypothetical protein